MNEIFFVFPGLSELDAEEIQEALDDKVEIVEPDVPEGTIAEPATIAAIVTISPLIIGALAMWLSKKRRAYLRKETILLKLPNGAVLEKTLEIKSSSEEETREEIAAAFNNWLADVPKYMQ